MAANGQNLNLLGKADVSIHVGGVKAYHGVLVATGLTQRCLLGADFLQRHGCVVEFQQETLFAGGMSTPLKPMDSPAPLVCHLCISETTTIPAQHQALLPVQLLGGRDDVSYVGVVEPEYNFVDRRGILVAHSISCVNHSKTIVQVLNPSTDAVTLRKSERIGKFTSLEEASAVVCTLDTPNRQSSMEIEAAIKSLEEKAESTLVPLEKAQLTALLHKY